MTVEERRRLAREIIKYLESKGVDVSAFYPDFPKSLMLTGLLHMLIQHERTPFIDEEDLPVFKRIMEKMYAESAEENRRAFKTR
ncbi:hypothetical protein ISS40_07940 [Candidatus Bathyarchaeota archaeon]|nr:hypothetical protein [Candidatus Bathyarchaeota archaeon]